MKIQVPESTVILHFRGCRSLQPPPVSPAYTIFRVPRLSRSGLECATLTPRRGEGHKWPHTFSELRHVCAAADLLGPDSVLG